MDVFLKVMALMNKAEKESFLKIRTREDLESFAEAILLNKKEKILQHSSVIKIEEDKKERNWIEKIIIDDERKQQEGKK